MLLLVLSAGREALSELSTARYSKARDAGATAYSTDVAQRQPINRKVCQKKESGQETQGDLDEANNNSGHHITTSH